MKKRIIVLGGAGYNGSEVTRSLLSASDINEVVIGEKNLVKAKELVAELKDERVHVEYVDVTDEKEAIEKIKGYDVLMNCTHFSLFNRVIRIAAKAGIDYADLGPLPPTAEQYSMVKNAGITAIPWLGISEGLTNILAKKGAELMDSAEEIHIHFVSFRSMSPSPGLLATILWELGPQCDERQYYFNGRFVKVPPFQGSKTVEFPEPVGEQVVYFSPHGETLTLAKNIPGVKFVSVRGTWDPKFMHDIAVLNRYGVLDDVDVEYKGQKINVLDFTSQRLWNILKGKVHTNLWALFINVEVVGRKNGKLMTVVYNVSHPVEWKEKSIIRMTGIPAAVGVILLARRGQDKTGLLAPEEYYDPEEFLGELDKVSKGAIKVTEEINTSG